MSTQEAEAIITDIWDRHWMTDNSGTDKVRDELEAALLAAYEAGKKEPGWAVFASDTVLLAGAASGRQQKEAKK